MEITFTKTAQRTYKVLVQRDDGAVLDVQTFDRPARLPHDVSHFAVESELALKYGFWGLLAGGVIFPNVRVVGGRAQPHAAERSRALLKEAGQSPTEAETLVSFMVDIADSGIEDWPEISTRLKHIWKPRRSQRGPLSREEVLRVCERLRSLEKQWEALPIGAALTFRWGVQHKKQRHNQSISAHSRPAG